MRVSKMFRFRSDRPSVIIAALVIGMALSVAGSVLATSIGDSLSVSTTLSVTGASTLTGNVGVATSTAGSVLGIQGVGNFVNAATSTIYTPFVTSNLIATSTVLLATNTGFVGIATSSPGSLFSIHGVANFTSGATSTVYSILRFPIFSATSTVATSTLSTGGLTVGNTQFVVQQNSGNIGIGTSTPGSLLSIQGVANFAQDATSTIYSRLTFPIFMATSTTATSTLSTGGFTIGATQLVVQQTTGRVGIGTSTPASLLSIQGVANFAADATSTVYGRISFPSWSATSTVATTTISTGGFQVGTQGSAAFTVLQSATTSVGVGTSTVTSHQFGVGGNALIGAGANGTSTLTVNASGVNSTSGFYGGCIQLRAADGEMVRIYASTSVMAGAYTNNGLAMPGRNLVVEAGMCR